MKPYKVVDLTSEVKWGERSNGVKPYKVVDLTSEVKAQEVKA